MSQEKKEVEWEVQKKLNIWEEKRRATAALEELMDGKVRYLKFINIKLGRKAYEEVLGEFVKDMYDKNMGGLTKLGANVLGKVSKKVLRNKIIGSYWINLQHLVNLNCLKKLEFSPERVEIAIKKCTAKRAFKLALRNNNVKDVFTEDDFCVFMCHPLFNRLLEVAKAQSSVDFQKRGCQHTIEFIEK